MLSNEDTILKEVYSPFNQKLSFDDFQNKINSLTIDKWVFVGAVLLYQQAVKCGECNPDIGMVLLCSCADALQLVREKKSQANFMKFYLSYCPSNLRTPPLEYYPDGKIPLTTTPFDKALHYIYKQFRCLYVHEGIGHLTTRGFYDRIKDKDEKDIYAVDIKVTEWFKQITFERLFAMLTNYPRAQL